MCGAPRSSQKYKTKAPSPCKGKIMIRVFGSCVSKLRRASAGPIEFLLKVIIGRHFMSHQTPPTKATLLIHAYGYVRCHAWQPFETGLQACNAPFLPESFRPTCIRGPSSNPLLPTAPTTPEWYSSSVLAKSAVRISNGFKAFEKF